MNDFTYIAVTSEGQALKERSASQSSKYLAGGTNLLDHLRLDVEKPNHLIDIRALPYNTIEDLEGDRGGGLKIGATVSNTDLAYDARVMKNYKALSEAILAGASPQLRNAATVAGNLLQRTRCYYFRDAVSPCNKRQPGTGCSAIGGVNRIHAILGTSDACIATHPSDMCVALAAFDATIHTKSPDGSTKDIPFNDFYIPYGQDPAKENVLGPSDLITHITLPKIPFASRSAYLKARDRASYEFSISSAAVALDLDGQTIKEARVALGGVATKPWRSKEAEAALKNQPATEETFRKAAAAAVANAKPQKDNAFKIQLIQNVLIKTLTQVAQTT